MKTKIFKNYSDFLKREDLKLNGVSEEFSKSNLNFEKENETNKGCWNCYRCSDCSDCSDCYRCYRCYRCYSCSDCYSCYSCSDCSDLKLSKEIEEKKSENWFKVPIIENIHTKVLEAVKKEGALNMGEWHTCDTTHCRGGWVEFLAGKEGNDLAKKSSTLFAAMQIYKASSKIEVSPVRFFETNEKAMEDIKRCAEEESKLI